MPWSALPEHLNSPEKWSGTDNDKWWMRWEILTKGWLAFGPRATEWWARWKFPPKVLLKIGGAGPWRYENIGGLWAPEIYECLSRCQYFKRWAFVVEWPLSFRFHIYWRKKDVPVEGASWVNEFSIGKLFFIYGPTHWDADLVYWLLSFYVGGQWK